jgi:hypothetical protein
MKYRILLVMVVLIFITSVCRADTVARNCIFWNGGNEIGGWTHRINVSHSIIEGGWPGEGNINQDPLFVNPGNGDFSLQTGSPCIDAGDNDGVPPDTADLDNDGDITEPTPLDLNGTARFADDLATVDTGNGTPPIVDMGAFEYLTPDPCADFGGDTDEDGICDDGDGSGTAGDNPCTSGVTEDCDDNCVDTPNANQDDFDSDGVGDDCDTCTDTDGDGYGNPGFPANTCSDDNCPDEDSTGFDTDGDGCIDSTDGLIDIVEDLVEQGVIDEQMENSLLSKIENASQSATKDNICAAVNQLQALINQIDAQRGKKITDEAADAVIAYTQSVIDWYLDQLAEGESC